MKPSIFCLCLTVLAACGKPNSTSATKVASTAAPSPLMSHLNNYTCADVALNAKLQTTPLWSETFSFGGGETVTTKNIGVTSPGEHLIVEVSRRQDAAGAVLNLQIYNSDTHGKAIAQFADGAANPTVLYSTNGDDIYQLSCLLNQ